MVKRKQKINYGREQNRSDYLYLWYNIDVNAANNEHGYLFAEPYAPTQTALAWLVDNASIAVQAPGLEIAYSSTGARVEGTLGAAEVAPIRRALGITGEQIHGATLGTTRTIDPLTRCGAMEGIVAEYDATIVFGVSRAVRRRRYAVSYRPDISDSEPYAIYSVDTSEGQEGSEVSGKFGALLGRRIAHMQAELKDQVRAARRDLGLPLVGAEEVEALNVAATRHTTATFSWFARK